MSVALARRYAQAFYDFARDKDDLPDALDDFQSLADLIRDDETTRTFMTSPALSAGEKTRVMAEILQDRVSQTVFQCVLFLIAKRREEHLEEICRQFREIDYTSKGIRRISFRTPFSLAENRAREIEEILKLHFRSGIDWETRVEPELIGGFQLRVDGTVMDFSARSQLSRFEDNIIHAKEGR